jgi:drug/metabolite transporter (DMT)-like permease
MILMLICFALSADFSKKDKKASGSWFLFVLIAFLTTGSIGVMQKWHQSSEFKDELDGFLIIAFLFSFIFSLIGAFVTVLLQKKNHSYTPMRRDLAPFAIALMIVCGICAAANNKMNLYLSGVMSSAVFFPIVNGGGMILSAIASLFLFKEKFNAQKWVGISLGIVAVVLICNPF